MKMKKSTLSSQLLILILAALVLVVMAQVARAQSTSSQNSSESGQVLQIDMPQKSLGRRLMENTSLNYYHQFLGPTVGGPSGETYNVFQEGHAPYQSFHAMSLRYQMTKNWAIGASLAAVNAYGDTVTSQQGVKNNLPVRDEFFNARAFLGLPAWKMPIGTLYTTFSYEAPTSTVARRENMRYGLVLSQSFALPLESYKWSAGLLWQYYRAYYEQNIAPAQNGYAAYARQTVIISGGPYLNYRFNDRWGMNSSVTFDWDQRGAQTSTGSYNNNLPDRARLGVSYYPTKLKNIANVGLFTQGLLDYTTDTHAVGGEVALKF